ncbi:Scr1 family TA system antitoxin-like transcriptional regulator [Actinacidiphila epipremni]|uniref:Scr1 family TA system antitoxin-like transcriptional regulator n=1 Tax=Actinacidiphila epipremni TaxID=2053013 RepID=UPI0038994747
MRSPPDGLPTALCKYGLYCRRVRQAATRRAGLRQARPLVRAEAAPAFRVEDCGAAASRTPDHACTLIREDNPGGADEEIKRRVHVRIARQALLTRRPRRLAWRWPSTKPSCIASVGGRETMAAQLDHLVRRSGSAACSCTTARPSGSFTVLRFLSTVRRFGAVA